MTTDAMWTDYTIESVTPAKSGKGNDKQHLVYGKYEWTKFFAVKLFKNTDGSGYPNVDESPEIFEELSGKGTVEQLIKVKVARGDLTKKYQAEYDKLASKDENVKISEEQSTWLLEAKLNERTRFMFHWYLVSPYWGGVGEETEETDETNESSDKVIVTYKDGDISIPASGTDTGKTIQEIKRLLNKLLLDMNTTMIKIEKEMKEMKEISNSVPKTVTKEETEELSEDDEIDKLLNDDPAGDN